MCKQQTSVKTIKKHDTPWCKIKERQGGPLPSIGERPALAQLINTTDVDEAAEEEEEEDAGEPSGDKSAPADSAANDDEPADDQQVTSEAPATRLVNVERPPSRRLRASITTSIIPTSNTFFSLSLQSFAPNVLESRLLYGPGESCLPTKHDDVVICGRQRRLLHTVYA